MEKYIGVKIVDAEPMFRVSYGGIEAFYKKLPDNLCKGFTVEDGYFIKYPNGLTSWSPKKQFEKECMRVDDLREKFAAEPEMRPEWITPNKIRVNTVSKLATGAFIIEQTDIKPLDCVGKGIPVPDFTLVNLKNKKSIVERLDLFFEILLSWGKNGVDNE